MGFAGKRAPCAHIPQPVGQNLLVAGDGCYTQSSDLTLTEAQTHIVVDACDLLVAGDGCFYTQSLDLTLTEAQTHIVVDACRDSNIERTSPFSLPPELPQADAPPGFKPPGMHSSGKLVDA